VADAWNAGLAHVDVYAFMCPNCAGNNPPSSAVSSIVNYLSSHGVRYGQLWFDVERARWLRRFFHQSLLISQLTR
jgi:hypothetical protein